MSGKRLALVVLLVAIGAGGYLGVRAYLQHRADVREEAEMASFRSDWSFDPNDPKLIEARFLATDGIASVSLGFPTVTELGGDQIVTYVSVPATFIDFGAQQIHMASKPTATLADIPLGSFVKLRVGPDGTNPKAYIIYDILVIE